jgi:hypothetical protein
MRRRSRDEHEHIRHLDALRLSPDAAAIAGTREVLAHVAVRKPNRTEFVRVHPDSAMSLVTAVFIDKEERETFFVAPAMREALVGEIKPVLLMVALTRQGVVFIWPVPMPDESGRRNAWAETARQGAELAKSAWVRLAADLSLGAYRLYQAEGALSEPTWSDKPLPDLLEIAFRNRIIDSDDHPVIRRLRGLT